MSKLLFPSEVKADLKNAALLTPVDLEKEDPELLEILRQQGEYETRIAERLALSWYRAGTGPTPTQGGLWIPGSTLAPLGGIPTGVVDSIICNYSRQNWSSWQSQISLRLYITNAAQTLAWTTPLDVASGSTTITASGAGVPADCRLTLQIKVGNIVVGLYQPPYISSYDCTVYYN